MSDDIPPPAAADVQRARNGERILDLMEILKAALAKDGTRTTTNPKEPPR